MLCKKNFGRSLKKYKEKNNLSNISNNSQSMQTKLYRNAPKTRCYKCGTEEIKYICHHCGKPMCKQHTFFVSAKASSKRESEENYNQLLSKEFIKLIPKDTKCGEEPFHCEECIHIMRGWAWKRIAFGTLLILISFMAIPNNRLGSKLLGIITGGGLVSYGIYANKQRKKQILELKPPLPLLPNFDLVQIKETLTGSITLDSDGNYDVSVLSGIGQLNIDMSLPSEERKRLKPYQKKYGSAETFHAGFLVLKGSAGFQFTEDTICNQDNKDRNNTIIPLVGRVSNQPFLCGEENRNAEKINRSFNYSLFEIPNRDSFPIQLILSFFPESDRRILEIIIQWNKPENNIDNNSKAKLWNLRNPKIESLKIEFPRTWGRVENSNKDHLIEPDNSTIIWNKVEFRDRGGNNEDRSIFQVQFENSIEPQESSVSGQVKVGFQGTLSGLDDTELFFPTGKKHDKSLTKIRNIDSKRGRNKLIINTEVNTDFNLSLSSLRYQYSKNFPELSKKNNNSNTLTSLKFPNVSPNYETVILLSNVISENEFYIKQIIETKPVTNPRTNFINRVWSILGRWYEGVYPIDFQIDIEGEEIDDSELNEFPGKTEAKLTVKGTYSNAEMENKIENIWEQLKLLIDDTLTQISEQGLKKEQVSLPPSYIKDAISMNAEIQED